MRKILLPLIILLLATASKAQYVNIPDSNFRNFLIAKYPACFNASKQMDTTCSAIVNETVFALEPVGSPTSGVTINSFNGLQYFKSINKILIGNVFTLNISYNSSFTSLNFSDSFYPASVDTFIFNADCYNLSIQYPKTLKYFSTTSINDYIYCPYNFQLPLPLPNTLKYFSGPINIFNLGVFNLPDSLEYFSSENGSYLTSIDSVSMHNKLKFFRCNRCNIKKMGNLSANLEHLDISKNSTYVGIEAFNSLPNLPNALQYLDCSGNDSIRNLPNLPNSLKDLYCNDCQIDGLPTLPNSMENLNCRGNLITGLSTLPNSLINLDCSNNKITALPFLPSKLLSLDCSNNKITNIPSLPNSLANLYCYNNKLLSLPSLSPNLVYLDCSSNKSLSVLPSLPSKLKKIYCTSDSILVLPNLPNTLELLDCRNNKLTSLPVLSFSLNHLYCQNNNLLCLPQLPKNLHYLAMWGNLIKCLPNIPQYCAVDAYTSPIPPLCNPTNNPNHCQFLPIVYGKVFTDNNLNGIKDTNESYRSKIKLKLTSNNRAIFTDATGTYTSQIDSIGSYTLKVEVPPLYSVVSDSINFNFTIYDTAYVLPDIALHPNVVKDSLSINITPINWRARPGFSFPYLISYENIGTTTINPTISFNYDSAKMIYDSSSNAIVVNTGNNLSLNVSSMIPGAVNSFVAYFRVKSTVPIGDTVVVTATASNAENVKLVSNVGGSFDPNDKQATPALTPTQLVLGKYIDYTIRFQNTGNDTAFNVVIADTLSSNLQASTLQMVGSSHNCKTTVVGNIVYFEFMNIKLADSVVNEKASHGFVSFKVKPKATLTNGNTVSNKAFIYFDYNAAVATNTAVTQIKNALLPVRITNYEASPTPPKEGLNNWTVLNKWTTSNEINLSHFVIQRSEDGRVFKSVGTVAAKGNGSYSFSDGLNSLFPSPLGEGLGVRLYYRLQIINKDGSYSFSEIKQIHLNELMDKQINIYPNPATTFVNIECKDAKQILIIDYLGRTIQQFNKVNDFQTINTKDLINGLYFVKVITKDGHHFTEKIIIEK